MDGSARVIIGGDERRPIKLQKVPILAKKR